MTPEEILILIRSGGKARDRGVRGVYEILGHQFLSFFASRGLDKDEGRDVLQETIVKIVRGADQYAAQGQASSWMWQIARNALLDYQRKIGSRGAHETVFGDDDWQRLEETTPSPLQCNLEGTADDCVQEGLARFSEVAPDRAYALMLQMEDQSIDEIAAVIGRTNGATKEYLSQCKKKIRSYIEHCTELLKKD